MLSPITLTKALLERQSLTPEDGGCLELIANMLRAENFHIENLDHQEVKNLFAYYGDSGPLFIFLGHVDVVPTGPESKWQFPPFSAAEANGHIYGRGAADMKSGVAAMTWALANFVKNIEKPLNFRVGILLTSDEEGLALHGVKHVLDIFQQRQIKVDYCLVGEPSCEKALGDTIKVGRRGSLSGHLIIHGIQGHIAYPQLADNPIHRFAQALQELVELEWDQGNEYFQATSLQFANIHAGTGANNVIPGTLVTDFNFRFSTECTADQLQNEVEAILQKHKLNYEIEWKLGGLPFLTEGGLLLRCTRQVIQSVTGLAPKLLTTGGTSDGRFIAQTGAEVIEFGVVNKTIHQINENVRAEDINQLAKIYLEVLHKMNEVM